MKLMSARSSRAPFPVKRRKPAPAIFPARSKSRSPSEVASSQWGFGAKSNVAGVPSVRTTTFPSASARGTDSCGTFGTHWWIAASSASISASRASSPLMSSPTFFIAATASAASFPAFFAWPIASEALFFSAFSVSTWTRSARRCSSSASQRSTSTSVFLKRQASRTRSASPRMRLGSSMVGRRYHTAG